MLDLSSNSLIAEVPSIRGDLTLLESLDLSQNRLSGKIPQEIMSPIVTYLAYLNLSDNLLMGPITQGKQFGKVDFWVIN